MESRSRIPLGADVSFLPRKDDRFNFRSGQRLRAGLSELGMHVGVGQGPLRFRRFRP